MHGIIMLLMGLYVFTEFQMAVLVVIKGGSNNYCMWAKLL